MIPRYDRKRTPPVQTDMVELCPCRMNAMVSDGDNVPQCMMPADGNCINGGDCFEPTGDFWDIVAEARDIYDTNRELDRWLAAQAWTRQSPEHLL